MARVLLFHHVLGITQGMIAFADELRSHGHEVHTPDLYDGRLFDTLDAGFEFNQSAETPDPVAIADAAAADLGPGVVYAGFSMGVMQAQRLAQTTPTAAGALLFESCIPVTGEWAFGAWPDGVPVQIHGMAEDEFFAGEGDLDAAKELIELVDAAELYVYPGNVHLFADNSLATYDAPAATRLMERVITFLEQIDDAGTTFAPSTPS